MGSDIVVLFEELKAAVTLMFRQTMAALDVLSWSALAAKL